MPELSTERFKEAVLKVVKLNERFIPPYETGASLYIRPLLIGTGAQVGVKPANEYLFVIFVTPVGPYFKGGFSMPSPASMTVRLRWGQVRSRWVVTMLPVCVPVRKLTRQVIQQSSIWMPRKRNIWMNAVPPISLALRTIHTSLRCQPPFCLLLPIRV